jgi:hypothetical protein
VCWCVKKGKVQKSRGKRCVLLTGRYQLRGAFETVALASRQANQGRSSAVVKRDRLSSIDITERAVDKVVPESDLVALGRTPWSPWPKASPRRICALAVTFRWRIALHSMLLPADRGWPARSDRICFTTQTRSVHTHAAQQTVGPLHPRLHFHCTICFRQQRLPLHERKRPTLHKRLQGSDPRDSNIPIKTLFSPERDRRHPNMALVLVAPRRVHLGRRTLQVRMFCHSCSGLAFLPG